MGPCRSSIPRKICIQVDRASRASFFPRRGEEGLSFRQSRHSLSLLLCISLYLAAGGRDGINMVLNTTWHLGAPRATKISTYCRIRQQRHFQDTFMCVPLTAELEHLKTSKSKVLFRTFPRVVYMYCRTLSGVGSGREASEGKGGGRDHLLADDHSRDGQ